MASLLNALQLALGAGGAGISGYQRAQAQREEEERLKKAAERQAKKEEDAAQLQRDMFRLNLIQATGGRLGLPTDTTAPSAPTMALPSSDSVMQRALARTQTQAFGPMATPATQSALEPGRRQALGMETPPLARTSLGALLDQQTGRLGITPTAPTPTEAAQAPTVPQRRREKLGGMEFEIIPGETPAEKRARELRELEETEGLKQRLATKAEEQRAGRMADLYVNTYVDEKGQPISRNQALAAALNNKTPIDMGFIEKPMSNAEKVRLSLDTARFNLSQKEYNLRLREQDRREMDSQLRREKMPVGAQRRLEGLDSGVLLVGDVREMLKGAPESIGPVKGRVFSSVLDAADQKGVAVRAAIEAMAGEIRNQRFGAALTASEAKFAEQFLPGAKDSYETAMSKLDQLDRYLETKRKGVFITYQQPYRPIYPTTGEPAPTGGAANPYR